MACEYIFFDRSLCDRFVCFLAGYGIRNDVRPDEMEGGFVVELPDGLADDVEEAIEAEYDALMDEQRALVEASEGDEARDLMGISITLPDGQPCVVRLPAAYARRLFDHFSVEEIQELVSAVARDVANPNTAPLCRRV